MSTEEKQRAGAQISTKALLQSVLILLALMIAAGVLTRVVPAGRYARAVQEGREVIDPDSFHGGRRQQVLVDDRNLGEFANFQKGRWIETPIDSDMTSDGQLHIQAKNTKEKANAVISIIEWLGPK